MRLLFLLTLISAAANKVQVIGLESCTALTRLDLSNNDISTNVDSIAACSTLRWLSLAKNNIVLDSNTNLSSTFRDLTNLQVLNMAHNKLSGNVAVGRLKRLKALILNNNDIVSLSGLNNLTELDTLVLSSNSVYGGESLEKWLRGATALEKLSLSHNPLKTLHAGGLSKFNLLRELRINHCQLKSLPECLKYNTGLRILEAGGNNFECVDDICVVRLIPSLEHIAFKGCPFALKTPGYEKLVLDLVPALHTLDNRKIVLDSGQLKKDKFPETYTPGLTGQKDEMMDDQGGLCLNPDDLMAVQSSGARKSSNQATGVVKIIEKKSRITTAGKRKVLNKSDITPKGKAVLEMLHGAGNIASLGGWD